MNPQEPTVLQRVPTQDVGQVSVVLWVPGTHICADTAIVPGTTLVDFQAACKADATMAGFGNYVLSREPAKEREGYLGYTFVRPKTAKQRAIPFKSEPGTMDLEWPNVLRVLYALNGTVVDSLDESGGGLLTTNKKKITVDRMELIPGGVYPTKILTEEFLSDTPFTDLRPVKPMPTVVSYNYGGGFNPLRGSITALHGDVFIPELLEDGELVPDFGTPNPQELPWGLGQFFPKTNHVTWIKHVRWDEQRFENGVYHRKRITIMPPPMPRALVL